MQNTKGQRGDTVFGKRKNTEDPVLAELTETLRIARENWEHTCAAFDELTDPALLESCIMELSIRRAAYSAARRRLRLYFDNKENPHHV